MKAQLSAGLNEARGKLGGICGQKRKSGAALTKLSVPYALRGRDRSPAQQAQNTAYGEAIGAWHALSFIERAGYDMQGELENISGFNFFIRETLSVSRYDSAKYDSGKYS
jgi:hypothetical protein